jgi:hypothetical protein
MLRQCPCGKTPESLIIVDSHSPDRYDYVGGDCCGEWLVEFKNDYKDGEELDKLMVKAWNNQERG